MDHRLAIAVLLAAMFAVIGCGGGDSAQLVSGSVTYNGQPVENGYITFSPTSAGQSFAAPIVGGKYRSDKAATGQFQILITATNDAPIAASREEAAKQSAERRKKSPPQHIPEDAAGNGQTVEIKDGAQTLDFALTGPPRQ
jgi:phage tail sheath gpL-like